jgi:hypothetical protein
MTLFEPIFEPKFHVGEIVKWNNKINSKYIKIVTVYKLETENGKIIFRYGGLKEVDACKWSYLEMAIVNCIFDDEELIRLEYTEQLHINTTFEPYKPNDISLDIIAKPNSNNLFAINFKNTINPKIKIKSIQESVYSKQITNVMVWHKYVPDYAFQSHATKFVNKQLKLDESNWKEYIDVDTLKIVYVNPIRRIVSKESPKSFIRHDIDEICEDNDNPITRINWIHTFRKLFLLLQMKNCDHIIDMIKTFLIPNIKYCYGDIVYNNEYDNKNRHFCYQPFLEERSRTSKSVNYIIHDIFFIKDHNKLWKPRYLLITLEHNYKLGYCDEETLTKVEDMYIQTVHDKINNLSKYLNSNIKSMNEIWEDSDYATYNIQPNSLKAYIKKRKIMLLKACRIIKTFKQYKGDVYKKNLLCTRIIEPII